jgi:hypothetical protein
MFSHTTRVSPPYTTLVMCAVAFDILNRDVIFSVIATWHNRQRR